VPEPVQILASDPVQILAPVVRMSRATNPANHRRLFQPRPRAAWLTRQVLPETRGAVARSNRWVFPQREQAFLMEECLDRQAKEMRQTRLTAQSAIAQSNHPILLMRVRAQPGA
jgi:hypothetical protein